MFDIEKKRFRSEKHVFTEEINKTALSSNDDKKNAISWFDRNICRWNKQTFNNLVCKKEKIKCNNLIKQCKNV